MEQNRYDVIIIGAGPSGIFCAYELKRQRPELKVLMIEKGRAIEKRQCPKRKTNVCMGLQALFHYHRFCRGGGFLRRKAVPVPGCGRKPAGDSGV